MQVWCLLCGVFSLLEPRVLCGTLLEGKGSQMEQVKQLTLTLMATARGSSKICCSRLPCMLLASRSPSWTQLTSSSCLTVLSCPRSCAWRVQCRRHSHEKAMLLVYRSLELVSSCFDVPPTPRLTLPKSASKRPKKAKNAKKEKRKT